jgi:hypothetical protein
VCPDTLSLIDPELPPKFAVPLYVPVTTWSPCVLKLVAHVAVPPVTFAGFPPEQVRFDTVFVDGFNVLNVTVPSFTAGPAAGVTVAVNVKVFPGAELNGDVLVELTDVVVVCDVD